MNISNRFLFLLIAISVTVSAKGQYPGMTQVYRNMAQQQASQQARWSMTMMNNNHSGVINNEYKYTVILKDSTFKVIDSKINYDEHQHKSYLLLVDKQYKKADSAHRFTRIYPDQTLAISHKGYNIFDRVMSVKGLPNDTAWMFKVDSGAINTYSYLGEQDDKVMLLTITGIQLQNGPIVSFVPDNLKKMISADNAAMKYFDEKKYYKSLLAYNKNIKKAIKNKAL